MSTLSNGKESLCPPVTEDISIGSGLSTEDGIDLNGKATLQQTSEDDLEKQKLMNEYREELTKIQEDIATLRLVLNDKIKRENELKTLLGISFVDEIKQDFAESFNSIKSTTAFQKAAQTVSDLGSTLSANEAYQKTSASLKTATQKLTPAIQTLGGSMKSSLGNLRNTSMFKSFEAGIGSTFGTVKNRMKSSQSEFLVDNNGHADSGMTTSKTSNGIAQDTILEDKEKN